MPSQFYIGQKNTNFFTDFQGLKHGFMGTLQYYTMLVPHQQMYLTKHRSQPWQLSGSTLHRSQIET